MQFEVIGEIRDRETIAQGHGTRELATLRKLFGPGRWRKCKGVATVLLLDTGEVRLVELHWYEAHGIGRRREKNQTLPGPMKKRTPTPPRLVVCIRNDDYELDLAINKVYEVIPDPAAERSGWIRIVDETGEDYLYPEKFFRAAEGVDAVAGELRRAS